jgi:DNA-binding MarR family transcriptional regulator
MSYRAIFSYASRLREVGNTFILSELAKAGLNNFVPSHGDILAKLIICHECNMKELAQHAHRNKATVTALVAKLERSGYVEKFPDPHDARGIRVRLTPKGQKLEPVFDAISQGLQDILAARLSKEESDTLEHLLKRCLDD